MKHPRDRYLSTDWTDGCIALSNEDMLEVWLLTSPDTPIEITP
jgi:L,D-peptidoglycan transpeptidase YkuD (ErfK/YbiS/YcfS/YnhG family)